MDKLTCIRAFVSVVEAGGFSSAERKTNISKTLLSKYVAQLENELNVRLLQRTTRQINLTSVGRNYYEGSLQLLEQLDELENAAHETHSKPKGKLYISAPTTFAERYVMQVVSEFSRKYPEIDFNMALTDRVVDLVEEGFDLALRIADLQDSCLVAKRLCNIPLVVCASTGYLQRHGKPEHPRDLAHHQCVIDSNFRGGGCWGFEDVDEKLNIVGKYVVNSAIAVRELVLRDHGVSVCPRFVIDNDIAAGTVQVILEDFKIPELGLCAVYSHRKYLSAKVRLFIDELAIRFSGDWMLN